MQVNTFDIDEFQRLIEEDRRDLEESTAIELEIKRLEAALKAKRAELQSRDHLFWGATKAGAYARDYISKCCEANDSKAQEREGE